MLPPLPLLEEWCLYTLNNKSSAAVHYRKEYNIVLAQEVLQMQTKYLYAYCACAREYNVVYFSGVHDAIKRMYLKRLYFGIAGNAEGTKLLEVSFLK